MAYDTSWSDSETLFRARQALVQSKGFSLHEAEQAVAGLVESGFLIREKTSRGTGVVRDMFSDPPQPDHLVPVNPQHMQILYLSLDLYGPGKIMSVESQLPFDESDGKGPSLNTHSDS